MNFTVALQNAAGENEVVRDVHDFVHSVACERPETVLARRADPYEDTELTGAALARFRTEWQEAKELAVSELERKTWEQVAAMAARAAEDTSLRLVLLGD